MSKVNEFSGAKLDHFNLKKVSKKEGGLNSIFSLTREVNGVPKEVFGHLIDKDPCHPTILDLFNDLRGIMGRVYFITFMGALSEAKEFKATAEQKAYIDKTIAELKSKITITGVQIDGTGENHGIKVFGTLATETNDPIPLRTHRIRFSGDTYGIEDKLKALADAIEDEVFQYHFEGKRSQATIDFQPHVEEGKGKKTKKKDVA